MHKLDVEKCALCGEDLDGPCIDHEILEPDSPRPPRAIYSLPKKLKFEFCTSGKPFEDPIGVFTTTVIAKCITFGPFVGIASQSDKFQTFPAGSHETGCWDLQLEDDEYCNWMKYVRMTAKSDQNNLIAFRRNGQLFFAAIKTISPGEELVVSNSAAYPLQLREPFSPELPKDMSPIPQTSKHLQNAIRHRSASPEYPDYSAQNINDFTANGLAEHTISISFVLPNKFDDLEQLPMSSTHVGTEPEDLDPDYVIQTESDVTDSTVHSSLHEILEREWTGGLPALPRHLRSVSRSVTSASPEYTNFDVIQKLHNFADCAVASSAKYNNATIFASTPTVHLKQIPSRSGLTSVDSLLRIGVATGLSEKTETVTDQPLLHCTSQTTTNLALSSFLLPKPNVCERSPATDRDIRLSILAPENSLSLRNKQQINHAKECLLDTGGDYSTDNGNTERTTMQRFGCKECDDLYNTQEMVDIHMVSHGANIPAMGSTPHCPSCLLIFSSTEELVKHVSYHKHKIREKKVQKSYYRCNICGKRLSARNVLEKHIKVVHTPADVKKDFSCDICGQECLHRRGMVKHVKEAHGKDIAQRRLSCHWCTMTFKTPLEKREHTFSHTKNGLLHCTLCPKTFPNYKNFWQHLDRNHSNKTHICNVCGITFKSKESLRIHSRLHSTKLNYKCEHCGQEFRQRNTLSNHVKRLHDPNKPSKHRKRKVLVHDGVEIPRTPADYLAYVFKCLPCKLGYRMRKQLIRHLQAVHPEQSLNDIPELALPIIETDQFPCPHCYRCFVTRTGLEDHLSNEHVGADLTNVDKAIEEDEKTKRKKRTFMHWCTTCDKKFGSAAKLLNHNERWHKPKESESVNT